MNGQHSNEPLCALADIGESGREVRVDDEAGPQWLMIFHREGELTAWRNVCPHQGRALNWAPGQFLFSDKGLLVCAHHGASFSLPAGDCVSGPCQGAKLTAVPVTVRDGSVFLDRGQ